MAKKFNLGNRRSMTITISGPDMKIEGEGFEGTSCIELRDRIINMMGSSLVTEELKVHREEMGIPAEVSVR